MKFFAAKDNSANTPAEFREQAHARVILLVVVAFFFGVAATAVWFSFKNAPVTPATEDQPVPNLSDSTKAVLRDLNAPVEIRCYALLDPVTVAPSLTEFSTRVKQLVSEYQKESNGKLKVTLFESNLDSVAKAAWADGIQPFNLDKGDACFLGLTVARAGQKEALSQLSPEWEPALESDLTRAILRITNVKPVAAPSKAKLESDAAATEEVKRSIPNADSLSVAEGTRILRGEALNQFKVAGQELDTQAQQIQQRLSQSQGAVSEAEQARVKEELKQLQAVQSEKLKQIAAQLDVKIAAWERLKSTSRLAVVK